MIELFIISRTFLHTTILMSIISGIVNYTKHCQMLDVMPLFYDAKFKL
jgi:hypothetical protein